MPFGGQIQPPIRVLVIDDEAGVRRIFVGCSRAPKWK